MSELNAHEFLLSLLRKNHSKIRNKSRSGPIFNYSKEEFKIYEGTEDLLMKLKQKEISPNIIDDIKDIRLNL